MSQNKHRGSDFDEYLLEGLRESDELVFLHIKEAIENPDISEPNDYQYLIKAIADVAKARGKGEFIEKSGISRQGLHKILNGKSIPSIQNVMALLAVVGLKFSVEKVGTTLSDDCPASALDVAQYAASLMPRNSTYMKLEKIVYYAQAESLVHYKRPLFKEKIEAWAAGPVVRELFEKHKGLRYLSNHVALGSSENLTAEQKACIRWAIDKFGKMDGDTLSHLTHIELPWRKAREGISNDAHSQNEITQQSMLDFYSKLPNYSELDESEI
ncbi:MAG: type II toxin-antitoxin system antitoxin SocA domain-containing protein [Oligoflexus sp.]